MGIYRGGHGLIGRGLTGGGEKVGMARWQRDGGVALLLNFALEAP